MCLKLVSSRMCLFTIWPLTFSSTEWEIIRSGNTDWISVVWYFDTSWYRWQYSTASTEMSVVFFTTATETSVVFPRRYQNVGSLTKKKSIAIYGALILVIWYFYRYRFWKCRSAAVTHSQHFTDFLCENFQRILAPALKIECYHKSIYISTFALCFFSYITFIHSLNVI